MDLPGILSGCIVWKLLIKWIALCCLLLSLPACNQTARPATSEITAVANIEILQTPLPTTTATVPAATPTRPVPTSPAPDVPVITAGPTGSELLISPLTPQPNSQQKATIQPTATPRADISNIHSTRFIVLPDPVIAHMHQIVDLGKSMRRNPYAFSKLGDSLVATPTFLTPFDQEAAYRLGDYAYLQPTIDYFAGSWGRYGVAIRAGLHAWSVFDPLWANKEWCEPNEHMLTCEIRLHNPAILLIQLGSNDASPDFHKPLGELITYCLDAGVIPVLITKADRHEGDNRNNKAIRQVATEYQVPLLEFDFVAESLPNRGLREDAVHLTYPETIYDYTASDISETGQAAQNLAILFMLDALRSQILEAP